MPCGNCSADRCAGQNAHRPRTSARAPRETHSENLALLAFDRAVWASIRPRVRRRIFRSSRAQVRSSNAQRDGRARKDWIAFLSAAWAALLRLDMTAEAVAHRGQHLVRETLR